ncbi:hypothetical protein BAA08_05380 [Bizionia sp. APA-3]|nr:hypothetical protein BAA08_05380 [Bizionia sp. APA-3]
MFILFAHAYFLVELMMCFAVIRAFIFFIGTYDVLRSCLDAKRTKKSKPFLGNHCVTQAFFLKIIMECELYFVHNSLFI